MKIRFSIIFTLFLFLLACAPAAEAGQYARVVARTCATKHAGYGKRVKCLSSTAPYGGGPMQVLVLKTVTRGTDPNTGQPKRYYLVHIPYRPNGLQGWVSSDRVQIFYNPYRIVINRAHRRAKLYRKGKVILRWRVVIGAPATPTPAGLHAIYGKSDRDDPFDGTGVMPFAYSNVLKQFAGGPGMLAIHGRSGTSFNDVLGSAKSHGCVRSNNNIVQYLLDHVPVGTAVRAV